MQPHNNYSADCFAQSVFFFATPFTIFVAFYLSPTHPLLRSGVKKQVIISPPRYRSCLAFLSRKYFPPRYRSCLAFLARKYFSSKIFQLFLHSSTPIALYLPRLRALSSCWSFFVLLEEINSKCQNGGIRTPAPRIVMVAIGGQHWTTGATGVARC